jgi:hypothetical protein
MAGDGVVPALSPLWLFSLVGVRHLRGEFCPAASAHKKARGRLQTVSGFSILKTARNPDLGQKRKRPVGEPAARGIGVLEEQKLEEAIQQPALMGG